MGHYNHPILGLNTSQSISYRTHTFGRIDSDTICQDLYISCVDIVRLGIKTSQIFKVHLYKLTGDAWHYNILLRPACTLYRYCPLCITATRFFKTCLYELRASFQISSTSIFQQCGRLQLVFCDCISFIWKLLLFIVENSIATTLQLLKTLKLFMRIFM